MSKFSKKGKKRVGAISTASLPDIVFMLLFFFMVVTVMREVDLMVEVKKPEATEVTKLENKSLVDNIYIGIPLKNQQGKHGLEPRIQLDDQIVNNELAIPSFLKIKDQPRADGDIPKVIISIKADKSIEMGEITKVKQILRDNDKLKVSYSTARAGIDK